MKGTRSKIVTRRTYSRPIEGTNRFETEEDIFNRVISHQRWLWERQLGRKLKEKENRELLQLKKLFEMGKGLPAGRTLWLGGTEVSKRREICQFNCAYTEAKTVHDIVDIKHALLNGVGVGFEPTSGNLNGFSKPMQVELIKSTRTGKGGIEHNQETWNPQSKIWTIKVGDSAEAWAKSIGKLLAGKYMADKLVFDMSEIRPAGERLSGYGWISSGDENLGKAVKGITDILNKRADQLLSRLDIIDIVNWIGTVLSSRRSAEIALFPFDSEEWKEFARFKKDFYKHSYWRAQSNNSLYFDKKPSLEQLIQIFYHMEDSGGSDPGLINKKEALRRGNYMSGFNPCGEIILPSKGICNLVEVNWAKHYDKKDLFNTIYLMARANYRQTLVNLEDGILQRSWHENNEYLRLCGVGATGIVQSDLTKHKKEAREVAVNAANEMARECGTPVSKNVTTIKPSGTLSKILECTEGLHKPLGKYVFNNIQFSRHEELVPYLREAGYRVFDHPSDTTSVLVTVPVKYDNVEFDKVDGKEVNLETAVTQLERYKDWMKNYVDHNASVTISYDTNEVKPRKLYKLFNFKKAKSIIEWLDKNWDHYVGVSFIYRNDPSKTALDLGFVYLPQEVVTKEAYEAYVKQLKPVDVEAHGESVDELEDDCEGGACPVR